MEELEEKAKEELREQPMIAAELEEAEEISEGPTLLVDSEEEPSSEIEASTTSEEPTASEEPEEEVLEESVAPAEVEEALEKPSEGAEREALEESVAPAEVEEALEKPSEGAEREALEESVAPAKVEEVLEEPSEGVEGAEAAEPPSDQRAWYVVHSYSGYENKVRKNLEHRIESMDMQNQIFQVVVPTEEEVEIKNGQRRTTKRRVFPGYILVEMIMNDDSWYVVRNTPGVTGFVGMGNKPVPLRPEEVEKIMKRMEAETPKVKVSFKPGQKVRIIDGPFSDFLGTVDDLNLDKGKVRILVSFFGRETPVELDFLQVEKV